MSLAIVSVFQFVFRLNSSDDWDGTKIFVLFPGFARTRRETLTLWGCRSLLKESPARKTRAHAFFIVAYVLHSIVFVYVADCYIVSWLLFVIFSPARYSSYYRKHEQSWSLHWHFVPLWWTHEERLIHSNPRRCNRLDNFVYKWYKYQPHSPGSTSYPSVVCAKFVFPMNTRAPDFPALFPRNAKAPGDKAGNITQHVAHSVGAMTWLVVSSIFHGRVFVQARDITDREQRLV